MSGKFSTHSGSLTNQNEEELSRGKMNQYLNGLRIAVVLYMNQDINNEAGIYLNYQQFLNNGLGGDRKVIFFNYHDDAKFLCQLVKEPNYSTAIFILFICKEQYRQTENIKEINRYCNPFWFPFQKTKFRDISLFIFIELCKLINAYRDIKLEVSASIRFLDIGISYINQIFNSNITKLNKNYQKESPDLHVSYQSIESIRRILADIYNYSSYIFYDLDNIPKPDQNEFDRQNTCSILDIFVRNFKTDDSSIKNKKNIIVVPNLKDSADMIIILMMVITAKKCKTSATICVKSGDDIFLKTRLYILVDRENNHNVSIINPYSCN